MSDDRDDEQSEPSGRDIRRAIRELVNNLAARCHERRTRKEVYWDALYTSVEALAANGGAIWEPVKGMPSQLKCAMGCGRQLDAELGGELRREYVEPFLAHVAEHGTTIIAPPGENGECSGGTNPTEHLWLFAPVGRCREGFPFAILHIYQRSGTPETTQQGYIRFMTQLCGLALDGLERAGGP